MGAAVDASNRGYKTLLLDKMTLPKEPHQEVQNWFTVGYDTFKMVIFLVIEALKERGIMKRNAPN